MSTLAHSPKRPKRLKSKLIPQEHAMGCGIACVAFVVGKSYKKIFSHDEESRRAWTRGYYCSELVDILKIFGRQYSWRALTRRTKKSEIPIGSIVFMRRSRQWPEGHYLVKVGENKYMNPWINAPSIKNVRAGFQTSIDVITHVITPI
jgi:ABC-type bacteriocin/lantibiotic exporter with double-glycine peptidase domain